MAMWSRRDAHLEFRASSCALRSSTSSSSFVSTAFSSNVFSSIASAFGMENSMPSASSAPWASDSSPCWSFRSQPCDALQPSSATSRRFAAQVPRRESRARTPVGTGSAARWRRSFRTECIFFFLNFFIASMLHTRTSARQGKRCARLINGKKMCVCVLCVSWS